MEPSAKVRAVPIPAPRVLRGPSCRIVLTYFTRQPVTPPCFSATAGRVVGVVEQVTGVSWARMADKERCPGTVFARRLLSYLMRQHTTLSFPEIAKSLGRKGHSSMVEQFQWVDRNPDAVTMGRKVSEWVEDCRAKMRAEVIHSPTTIANDKSGTLAT